MREELRYYILKYIGEVERVYEWKEREQVRF